MTWTNKVSPSRGRAAASRAGLFAILVFSLAACGSETPAAESSAPSAPAATSGATPDSETLSSDYEATIRIMEYAGTAPFIAVDEFVTAMLAEKFPNVTLEFEYINAESLSQRITSGVASGDPPDIIAYFPGPDFVKLAGARCALWGMTDAQSQSSSVAYGSVRFLPLDYGS